jgi:hypothetical protein
VHFAESAEPAAWIESRLHGFAVDVGSIIPTGFAAYARIFHPPYRRAPDGTMIPVRWREIAAANNRSVAAEMQRMDISAEPSRFSVSGEELWNEQPHSGSLPLEIAAALAAILPSHTTTPESCWFGVWEGFGDLRRPETGGAIFSVPERNLFLLHGRVSDVMKTLSIVDWSYRSPNLWWPDDRAWCVSTEIDFNWTYVGGPAACIQQILNDPQLEALPTHTEEGNNMGNGRA